MSAINKTPPLKLKEPVNVGRTQINNQDAHIHPNEQHQMTMEKPQLALLLLLLLLLLLQDPPIEARKREDGSKRRDSDPEEYRKEDHDQVNSNSAEYNTNSRKKRASKGRVFQCTGYPDCNMSFTRSEHLARHKRKHTGERPFTCPHCHKNFSRLDNLRQHKQTVHAYENFMGSSSNNVPIQSNFNPGGTVSITDANNTSYVPIANSLPKNSGVNKGAPESPLNYGFVNSPGSNAMISPPNTNSPVNYHLPYHNQLYHNKSYDLSSSGHNNSPYPESQIKTNTNEFKPKRRPRPLSLVHSFTNNTTPGDNGLQIRQLLKSAPAMYTTNSAFTYPPKSAPLTPNMVSPLSPLFRHAFNQTMDLPKSPHIVSNNNLRLPPYSHPVNSDNIPNNPANKNITLPPVQELPIPTQFNPIRSSKTWLKEVLNDESPASSNNTNDTNSLSVKEEDKHVSKKPTINNLLSPYNDDEFPSSVK